MKYITFKVTNSDARTLSAEYFSKTFKGKYMTGICTTRHTNGWTLTGKVHEDYYYWVNDFVANHPKYGKVWGNFESRVYFDLKKGYDNFIKHFPYSEWDYWDI